MLSQFAELGAPGRTLPPSETNLPEIPLGQRVRFHAGLSQQSRTLGHLRQKRDPQVGVYHFNQRQEARCRERADFLGSLEAAGRNGVLTQAVAVIQQEHRIPVQPALAVLIGVHEPGPTPACQPERIPEEGRNLNVAQLEWQRQQQKVQLPLQQFSVDFGRGALVQE